MHDPRVGRFFAVDPLSPKYPFYSPYQFSGNRLIDMVELEGLEPATTEDKENPPAGMGVSVATGELAPVSSLPEVYVTNSIGRKVVNAIKDIAISGAQAGATGVKDGLGLITGAGAISNKLNAAYNAKIAPATDNRSVAIMYGIIGAPIFATIFPETTIALGTFALNKSRSERLVGGFSSFFSQYASNKFDITKVDFFDVGMSTVFNGGGSTATKSLVDYKLNTKWNVNSASDTFLNYQSSSSASKLSTFTTKSFKPFLLKSTIGTVLQANVETYYKIVTTTVKNEIKTEKDNSK